MGQPYVGEIRMFAGNFAPVGWFFCDGTILSIAQYTVLFQLIGTTYGGDGSSTFGLPDLRGRVPIHFGFRSTDSTSFAIGQSGGVESVTLTTANLSPHTHGLVATTDVATTSDPSAQMLASLNVALNDIYIPGTGSSALASTSVQSAGGSLPHDNMQPFLCLNFIIAYEGVFPTAT